MAKKIDARLVLPGELVRLENRTFTVHHVEIIPSRVDDTAEVIVCFANGSHPNWDASSGTVPQWPTIGLAPGDKIEVLPKKPKVRTTWDDAAGEWKVEVEEQPPPEAKP